MSQAKVIQCFFDADMRNGHLGLAAIAKKDKIDVEQIEPGQYVVFLNSAKNRLKLYAANGIVAYYYKPGMKIDLHVISEIPRAFLGSGRLDYDAALRKTLEKRIGAA
jgi:hypothetical protein